jgi:hypothetical protein
VTALLDHIHCLESSLERSGARLVRTSLPALVQGRVFSDLITLRADLNPEQELLALVHELAHWLAHRDAGPHAPCAHRTIYEYEAEAVEVLVMARLGLACPGQGTAYPGADSPTDGLLSASVTRVISTSRRICQALGVEPCG